MAENKTDFVRDPEIIAKEQEKLIQMLYKNLKLDLSSNCIQTGKDLDGRPKIILKQPGANLTGNIFYDGYWKYGPYYLDGSNGRKTGFYKQVEDKDGKFKYLFIETENQYDKSYEPKNARDLSLAIISKNQNLAGQIKLLGDGKIQIIGAVHDIELPFTTLYYDPENECIVDSLNSGYAFKIKFTNAKEASTAATTTDASEKQSFSYNTPLSDYRDSQKPDEFNPDNHKGVGEAFASNITNMEDTFKNYNRGNDGDIEVRPANGEISDTTSHSFGNVENVSIMPNEEVEKEFSNAEVWVEACRVADNNTGLSNDSLSNVKYFDGIYKNIYDIITTEGKNGSDIVNIIKSVAIADNIPTEYRKMAAIIAYNYITLANGNSIANAASSEENIKQLLGDEYDIYFNPSSEEHVISSQSPVELYNATTPVVDYNASTMSSQPDRYDQPEDEDPEDEDVMVMTPKGPGSF